MAHTQDAIVYDPATNYLQMIIIPDDDAQLADPAFNPPGMLQLRVPRLSAMAVSLGAAEITSRALIAALSVGNITVTLAVAPAISGNITGGAV